jgi:hypothetical protein
MGLAFSWQEQTGEETWVWNELRHVRDYKLSSAKNALTTAKKLGIAVGNIFWNSRSALSTVVQITKWWMTPSLNSTTDLSRRHHLYTFSQNLGVDGKIFEEKLFILTLRTMFLQICSKICCQIDILADDSTEYHNWGHWQMTWVEWVKCTNSVILFTWHQFDSPIGLSTLTPVLKNIRPTMSKAQAVFSSPNARQQSTVSHTGLKKNTQERWNYKIFFVKSQNLQDKCSLKQNITKKSSMNIGNHSLKSRVLIRSLGSSTRAVFCLSYTTVKK